MNLAKESVRELEIGNISINPLSQSAQLYLGILKASFELRPETDLDSDLRGEPLSRLAEISDLRAKRFIAKWRYATPGFWAFLLLGFVAIAFCYGAYAHNVRRHAYMGLFFAFVGMSAFFIHQLSTPYSDPIKVSEFAFEELGQIMLRTQNTQ